MSHHIVCADGDEASLTETVETLREGMDTPIEIDAVTTVERADSALAADTAAVITEHRLPDGTGTELIELARTRCPDATCLLYTATDPDAIDTDAIRSAVTEYVGKGSAFGDERLTQVLETMLSSRSQRSYPVPQNETERLAGLAAYDLDDEALTDSLDRITDLAARHFEVETASVNIITDHAQEYVSCYGSATEWESPDREDSICTFTIADDDEVLTVEDITEDPRFESRSEQFVQIGIRSYMGATLTTTTGLALGSLCIYDDEPRSYTPTDEAYLRDLAALAMNLIERYPSKGPTAETDGEIA